MTDVPSADLSAEWEPRRAALLARVEDIVKRGQFVMGPEVEALEAALAQYARVDNAVACSSGTMALHLTLLALGVGPGDEVILPAFTFAAPLEAALLVRASPVLADVDPHLYTIDPDSVRQQITPKTRAIIAVSLFGQPANFEALRRLASEHGAVLIDDAAQSFGASLNGQPAGTLADVTCTSFFPTKPLGGIGDGGAVLSNDAELAARVRTCRDHGQREKYVHERLGTNGRLDSISCAALLEALPSLSAAISARNQLATRYDRHFEPAVRKGLIRTPSVATNATSTFAQYAVEVSERARVIAELAHAGVATAVHYPASLHRQPAYQGRVAHGSLEVSDRLADVLLCLPLFPTLSHAQQDRVIEAMLRAVGPRP